MKLNRVCVPNDTRLALAVSIAAVSPASELPKLLLTEFRAPLPNTPQAVFR